MPKIYSLHIGVNKLDPSHYGGHWNSELKYCINDAIYFRELAKSVGSTADKLLSEGCFQGPTAANLDNCLQQYSNVLYAGDLLFLTYSGHGGQLSDVHHDKKNGLDETWCLHDRQYLDDELWMHFSSLDGE